MDLQIKLRMKPIAFAALGAAFAAGLVCAQQQTPPQQAYPFQDPKLPVEQRVDNIISRLTLDEKIGMLGQVQPAIPCLGIAAFTNWTEGLQPIKELRGFERITLQPGETRTVRIPLKGNELSWWDTARQSFVVEPGKLGILLGASSADVRLEKTIEVSEK